jgi:O-antigen ligase
MSFLAYLVLCAFVFTLPWETSVVIIPGVGLFSKITGVLSVAAALVMVLLNGRVRRWHLFHVAALFFVLWAAAGQLYYLQGMRTSYKFGTFVQLFAVLWVAWELAPSWSRVHGLLLSYVLGCWVAALNTVLLFVRNRGALRRYAAGGVDPNDLAMTMVLALPMAWYLGMTSERQLVRWIARGYVVVGVFAVVLTGSRGGMIACLTALTLVPLTLTRLTPGRRATAIVLMGLAGTVAIANVPQEIIDRFASTTSQVEGGSISGRGRIWRAGLTVFAQRPFMGYGTGSFKGAVSPILGEATQVAHNSFISILVEEGLVGLVFYLTMMGAVFVSLLRLPTLPRRFGLVLFFTLGVAMLPLTWEDRKPTWFVLAALIGFSRAWVVQRGLVGRGWSAPLPPWAAGRRVRPAAVAGEVIGAGAGR